MRRTRRTLLRVLGLLVLLVALLGGLAAAGWLPPFNQWVEQRLLAELRVLGVETDATHLKELSWRRAVVGPARLELPGLVLDVAEARAELGWEVLARRGSPHVVIRGLALTVDLARMDDLRGVLQPQSGGFPYGKLEIEESQVFLRNGDRLLTLPLTGFFDSTVEDFRAELVVAGEALSGRFSIRGDLIGDVVDVSASGVRMQPARWVPVCAGILPSEIESLRLAEAAIVEVSGRGRLGAGAWSDVVLDARLPACRWERGGATTLVGAGTATFGYDSSGAWRGELKMDSVDWASGDRSAGASAPLVVVEPGLARVHFEAGHGAVAGMELAGGGDVELRWASGGLTAADAKLRLSAAGARGWSLASPAALQARWAGDALTLVVPEIDLAGERRVRISGLEATAGGFAQGQPWLVAKADAGIDANRWIDRRGKVWRVEPATVAGRIALNASLKPGAEAFRAEVSIPAQRRRIVGGDTDLAAALGLEAVINLDRDYVSGRASVEAREMTANHAGISLASPSATVSVRWPRVWNRSVARWETLPPERLMRDALWAGDYEVSIGDAMVRGGDRWAATGLDFKWASRGAELFETGGISVGLSAQEISWAGGRVTDVACGLEAGLDGGNLTASLAVADFPMRPTIAQALRWADGLECEGTWGFDPAVLSGGEPWSRWWPAGAAWELSGGVAVAGRNRLAANRWELGADIVLRDANLRKRDGTVAAEGIDGRVALDSFSPLATAPEQTLAVRRLECGGVGFDGIGTTFSYSQTDGLQVSRLEGAGFGGQLACSPFSLVPPSLDVATSVTLTGTRLERLIEVFEDVPAEAVGSVDGVLPVTWSGGRLGFGTGFLRLSPGEIGRVRFTRDLHLLTRDRRAGSPGYESLRQVEQSIQSLAFNRFQIDLHPKDADGQTMRIRLVGAPAGGEFAVPVSIDVNVNAPLEHFLNWGIGKAR